MTGIAIIENKISAIKKYLTILEGFKHFSKDEISSDITVKGAVERYLYLAVQSSIDLAEVVIAHKKLRKPQTFAESFVILKEEKIIPEVLASELVKMVGFRNIIAHDYEEIDSDIVYDILHTKLEDIEKFLQACSKIK